MEKKPGFRGLKISQKPRVSGIGENRGNNPSLEEKRDGKALFSAYKASGSDFDGIVTFDSVDIDTDNQMDKESGVFRCKIPGTYLFTFSGATGSTDLVRVEVNVNNIKKFRIYDKDETTGANLSYTWTLQLSVDDQVRLKVDYGKMYANSNERVTFTGLLVHAD